LLAVVAFENQFFGQVLDASKRSVGLAEGFVSKGHGGVGDYSRDILNIVSGEATFLAPSEARTSLE